MELTINGTARELDQAQTVAEVLARLELNPRHVAVEVNRVLVPRAEHAGHRLSPGDALEIVTLVGGG